MNGNAEANLNLTKQEIAYFEEVKYAPTYCVTFGCGKVLTLKEDLVGKVCFNCVNKKK